MNASPTSIQCYRHVMEIELGPACGVPCCFALWRRCEPREELIYAVTQILWHCRVRLTEPSWGVDSLITVQTQIQVGFSFKQEITSDSQNRESQVCVLGVPTGYTTEPNLKVNVMIWSNVPPVPFIFYEKLLIIVLHVKLPRNRHIEFAVSRS